MVELLIALIVDKILCRECVLLLLEGPSAAGRRCSICCLLCFCPRLLIFDWLFDSKSLCLHQLFHGEVEEVVHHGLVVGVILILLIFRLLLFSAGLFHGVTQVHYLAQCLLQHI